MTQYNFYDNFILMRVYKKYFLFIFLCLSLCSSCIKKQEIPLYEEEVEVIPVVDSLYNYSKQLYKEAKYTEASRSLREIIEKYPTSEKVDDALSLLLLSKYRLKDYKGVISTAKGKHKLYKGRSTEPDILYIIAQSFEKINENYEAARNYFEIIRIPLETSLKSKSEEKLKKIMKKLSFEELKNLAKKYEKTTLGCFTLYTAAKRGLEQGKDYEARKIHNHMKRICPNNKYTMEIARLLKGERAVKLSGAIGFLAPLTGEYSIFGKRVKNGLELALKGRKLRIVARDTKGNPIEAIRQVIDLIKNEGVFVIIGPILSMPMIAASGIANLLKVPIISPTATEEDISSIGPYVFQINVGLGAQAIAMAKYVTGTLGYYKIAILYPDDAYGNSLAEIFSEEAAKYGVQIVAKHSYPEGTTDFETPMTFIKDKNPEAIYIPCYPNEAVMIAPELRYYKIDAKILGADGWNDERVPLKGEKYVEGVIFTGSPTMVYKNTDIYKDFRRLYLSQYRTEPSRESALGYDTGILLLKTISTGAKDTESLTNSFQEIEPFAGTSGVVNPRGVFEGTVPFYTIKRGEIVRLK